MYACACMYVCVHVHATHAYVRMYVGESSSDAPFAGSGQTGLSGFPGRRAGHGPVCGDGVRGGGVRGGEGRGPGQRQRGRARPWERGRAPGHARAAGGPPVLPRAGDRGRTTGGGWGALAAPLPPEVPCHRRG